MPTIPALHGRRTTGRPANESRPFTEWPCVTGCFNHSVTLIIATNEVRTVANRLGAIALHATDYEGVRSRSINALATIRPALKDCGGTGVHDSASL